MSYTCGVYPSAPCMEYGHDTFAVIVLVILIAFAALCVGTD